MKYFRTASDELYERVRTELDAVWGHPSSNGTITCIQPAATALRDEQGRILLAADDRFLDYDAVADRLPELLSSGMVEEIDSATYHATANPTVEYR